MEPPLFRGGRNYDGYDNISLCIYKIWDEFIWKSLEIIFKKFLTQGDFPNKGKKANIVPIHKNNDHKIIKPNHPIMIYNLSQVSQASPQKLSGMMLDSKLNFSELKIAKANKGIRLIQTSVSFTKILSFKKL